MELKDIVVSLDLSKKLKEAGFFIRGLFSYKQNNEGHIYISETKFDEDIFLGYAYTSEELINFLPTTIKIEDGIYVANSTSYDFINKNEVDDEFPYAEFECFKIPDFMVGGVDRFYAKYTYQKKMVAFNQNLEGLYNNLFQFGSSEANCRGKMLLHLINEGLHNIENVSYSNLN
ncbi:hypothetical protein EIB75_02870 [Epilithonimonas vandammei]|uniref:Uncharacterized protein n=1 Tax=Epilithonimonas vandammei TaxID=2487072 RepID=A0A3G8ZCA2_9FLAO|nr:hypothetical protein [Epilithonimonas vandammei]AZI54267.1 hypothetical protein EIB75_02870 [Epilithonimonas vandammei]